MYCLLSSLILNNTRNDIMKPTIGKILLCAFVTSLLLLSSKTYSNINKLSKEAMIKSEINSVIARSEYIDKSYENFLGGSVYKEPFDNGVFIVNGDTPVLNEEELKRYFFLSIKNSTDDGSFGVKLLASNNFEKLIIDAPGGNAYGWSFADKLDLRYCVSVDFGPKYGLVKENMVKATLAWEESSNVRFHHLAQHDKNCDENQSGVVFDVRPVNVNGKYLARAFFPRYPRPQRNVLIDESSFNLDPSGKLQLVGILRHEIGHVLGFRHEHTRPSAGVCFEDNNWEPLTDYDAFSVMHYPQCKGLGDWSLKLTAKDKEGAAFFYGAVTE